MKEAIDRSIQLQKTAGRSTTGGEDEPQPSDGRLRLVAVPAPVPSARLAEILAPAAVLPMRPSFLQDAGQPWSPPPRTRTPALRGRHETSRTQPQPNRGRAATACGVDERVPSSVVAHVRPPRPAPLVQMTPYYASRTTTVAQDMLPCIGKGFGFGLYQKVAPTSPAHEERNFAPTSPTSVRRCSSQLA